MLSISLGPLALPVQPLLLLLAVWGASGLASVFARRALLASPAPDAANAAAAVAGNAVLLAAALGLLAARLAYLALNADLYAAAPWWALDVRDGGWHAPTGVLAGAAWLLWRGWRVPALRRAWAGATLAGAVGWMAAWALLPWATGAHRAAALPELALTDLTSGAPVPLRQAAAGRPAVVNLWASWCGPCRQEMPTLAAAQQRETAVGFWFVNQGEAAPVVRSYLASLGLPLRQVLLDSGAQLGPAVGSRGLPTTLFYDAQGRLVHAHFGVLNAPALEARLREMKPLRGSP